MTASIIFIDTEIDFKSKKVLDIGCTTDKGDNFHSNSMPDFFKQISGINYLCGHNILNHDLVWLKEHTNFDFSCYHAIDTLHLSPLLFPAKPYHALLKDDKLQTEELNNPLNDAIKAKELFYDEVSAFQEIDIDLQQIFFLLLKNQKEFYSFFRFRDSRFPDREPKQLIKRRFAKQICEHAPLERLISEQPIELAYSLALINTNDHYSVAPRWLIMNYPDLERVLYLLRAERCPNGCSYCNQSLDAKAGLKRHFGFDTFRTYGGKALQEQAVNAALNNKSLISVFPTGGGKSICFQLPALMSSENVKGLTVVISPLQSLMKDQVDNLEKADINEAVTINGLLDPIERAKSFERVENGSASILYISPESLRSKTIERLLLSRMLVRVVIDEAHCFSSWGHDFRVDYLYIGEFIQALQQKKKLKHAIPVSCFTATAKQRVIQDIKDYFKASLSLEMDIFSSTASRTNLRYKVLPKADETEKYNSLRNLIDEKQCPTIIYVSRTRKAYKLAETLTSDGYQAKAYHGKMEKEEKSANQDAFIRGDIQIMVATAAFGMGVDKKDVGMVIHYDISDSLENYVQEAGRAGRDEKITAECYVLFNEEDLSKHFILLNQTKLNLKEIQQIWRAIKELTRFRSKASNSALEIARKAGWDDSVIEIETRVITAIAALEEAKFLKRGQNMPRIFANSILAKNTEEAIEKINKSEKFNENEKQQAVRIIKKLFSSKNRKKANDESAESRIDYISDHLGIVKGDVINVINLLREEAILADTKDLNAFIKKDENINRSLKIVQEMSKIESFLVSQFDEQEKTFHIKELNEQAEQAGCQNVSPNKLKTAINFWVIKNWLKRISHEYSKNHINLVANFSKDELEAKLEKRRELSRFIVEFLFSKSNESTARDAAEGELILVEFSVHELKQKYEEKNSLFKIAVSIAEVEDALFYLSRIEAIKIEGGFLVSYNQLSLERLESDNRKQYRKEDYKKLSLFYENKIQQIHIVGEYAKKMINDYKEALEFVDDYFQLNYVLFLNKYFKGSRKEEIKRNLTTAKFNQLFGELSPGQLAIIKDNESQNITVAAGPGSGKTRVLAHKLASLILMEDVKHEQLLMLTFSRASATEFKKRLFELIGNAANFIEIKTFHSYCFDLLGRVGSIEKSEKIINKAVERMKNGDIETNRITKSVLVIDEAQDMDIHEFELIKTLMQLNDEIRVIAVGDDDQNIYEFRGANSQHFESFILEHQATKHELVENFRSRKNLVEFSNQLAEQISRRLKKTAIIAHQNANGFIRLTKHIDSHLVYPVVEDVISTKLSGTSCVLCNTNHEALQLNGLLLNKGISSKLIQTNEGFNICNLLEIRYFTEQLNTKEQNYIISDKTWTNAKRKLWESYKGSSKIELCIQLIKEFEITNPKKKYLSDFNTFIKESKLEDFINIDRETIFISTIHKAKGKEFDNIFLMLNSFIPNTDEKKRLLYVALTRAKQYLSIHLNGDYLDDFSCEEIKRNLNRNPNPPAELLVLQLTHKDIWLDYFQSKQTLISKLKSGDELKLNKYGGYDHEGNAILKFSNHFKEKIADFQKKGYELISGTINYIVYWQKEDENKSEIKIILPELKLKKNKTLHQTN